jgi:hypothetical protein
VLNPSTSMLSLQSNGCSSMNTASHEMHTLQVCGLKN